MVLAASKGSTAETRDHGALPPWDIDELPAPPPFAIRNLFRVIGPGAVLAATSIGGGEWLLGPAAAVKYSASIFVIVTLSIGLQVLFNLEGIRYTLYTGEPIYGGIMRLGPGPRFWAGFYVLLGFLQMGWPGLAGSAAATLLSAWAGRVPEAADQATLSWIATGILVVIVLILSFGGTVERMLEFFAWTMLVVVLGFLLFINLAYIPVAHSLRTLAGFFQFTGLPTPVDWALIGALVAVAGSGGLGNLTVTNWMRDKGFGMGAKVGAIPSAFGGVEIRLSHVGKIFQITESSIARWREWLRYVHTDQICVWGFFCFLGMYLNVNLATYMIPAGTDLQGMAAGAYQAKYLAERVWSGFWFLTLFNGFWILFKTHLGNTDIFVRTVADALWMASPGMRERAGGAIKRIYYVVLVVFSLWGIFAVRLASPIKLFTIFANMAGLIMVVAGLQILRVNRRFLPPELRAAKWREVALLICSAFYAFFLFFVLRSLF
jgi:hypothetical protein